MNLFGAVTKIEADEAQRLAEIWGQRVIDVIRRGDVVFNEAQIAKAKGDLERYKRCERLMKRTLIKMDEAVATGGARPEVLAYYVQNVLDKRPKGVTL